MRLMNNSELNFVSDILSSTEFRHKFIDLLPSLKVQSMEDGGMGGVKFLSIKNNRELGLDIASYEFNDEDGVRVIAKLSLDNYGDLYELDIWKTNFSTLIKFPVYS